MSSVLCLSALFLFSGPATGSECGLAPALAGSGTACERGELEEEACSWLPILEHLIADREPEAYAEIERTFGLRRFRAHGMVSTLQMLLPFLVDCPPARVASKLLDPAVNAAVVSSREGKLLVEMLFPSDPATLSRLELDDPDPALFARAERAARGLVELFDTTGLRAAMAATTRDGRILRPLQPGDEALFRTWSGGVTPYAPVLRQVDRWLESTSPEPRAAARAALRELARDPERPELAGIVYARAGYGFGFRGHLEEALVYLRRAESELPGSEQMPRWKALRQIAQLMQILMYRTLGRAADEDLVEARLRESGPMPVLEMLLETSGEASVGFLPGARQLLWRAAAEMGRRPFLEVQPVMEALELVSPETPGQVDPGAARLVETLQRIRTLLRSEQLAEALRELDGAMERQPSFLLAAPAGLIAQEALARNELSIAMRAIDGAVRLMEREIANHRSDEVTRSFMDASGFAPFVAAVLLAEKMGDPRLAFSYAERGRAFSTRRLLGSSDRGRATATAVSEHEAEIVRLQLDGNGKVEAEKLPKLRREFALLRLERQLDSAGRAPSRNTTLPSLEDVQALLGPDETILAFFGGNAALVRWRIDRDGFAATRIPWAASELDCLLSELRWQRTPIGVRSAAEVRGATILGGCRPDEGATGAGTELYTALLGNTLEAVDPGGRLILIPHGPLHRIPWAALRAPHGRFLSEDHELVTVPSAATLAMLRARERRESSHSRADNTTTADGATPSPR